MPHETLNASDLVFPLPFPATHSFTDKGDQHTFSAPRDQGKRRHAGVDLEARVGTPVLAMADGVVLRVSDFFYDGTGAIEVQHIGLGIVRYGEVTIARPVVFTGQRVSKGQTIGFVGRRSTSTRAMLHLELFSDWTKTDLRDADSLSQANTPPLTGDPI